VVKIRRAKDKKPKWEVYSDHHGEFAQRVPAGESDYILTADLKNLKPPMASPCAWSRTSRSTSSTTNAKTPACI
jgi:hypothetical protein